MSRSEITTAARRRARPVVAPSVAAPRPAARLGIERARTIFRERLAGWPWPAPITAARIVTAIAVAAGEVPVPSAAVRALISAALAIVPSVAIAALGPATRRAVVPAAPLAVVRARVRTVVRARRTVIRLRRSAIVRAS